MGSVILFNYAESPTEIVSTGDSVQTGSQAMFLMLFALSYGMTKWARTKNTISQHIYSCLIFLSVNYSIFKFSNFQIFRIHGSTLARTLLYS